MKRMREFVALPLLVAVVTLAGGCGRQGHDGSCPVRGTVAVNGKPAAGVYLQFYRVDDPGHRRADGCRSDTTGAFSLRVHGPGEYEVVSFWPTVKIVEGEEIEGDDRFAGKYRSLEKPVLKIAIADGDNPLPTIDLKMP
jgi:hypothetical protein